MGLIVSQLGGASLANDVSTNSDTFYLGMANNQSTGSWTAAWVSTTKLYYNPSTGTLNATAFNSLSDESLKENVSTISNAVSTIRQLDGVSFTWKDSGRKSYGVIAQRLEEILPELVSGDDKKTVNYSGLIAFLIESVKELNLRIEELENRK
jgi:hypothetical protein